MPSLTGEVFIDGIARVGNTLNINISLTVNGTGEISIRWYRDDILIAGANKNSYVLVEADRGSYITADVKKKGFSGVILSDPYGPIAGEFDPALTGSITITGITQLGQTLTIDDSRVTVTGTRSYRWYRDGSYILLAVSKSYTLVEADIGAVISAHVSVDGYSGVILSGNVGPVAGSGATAAKYGIEFRGEWIRMDNGDRWYIGRDAILVNGANSSLNVTLTRTSDNVVTATRAGTANYTLFASRLANASFNAQVVFLDGASSQQGRSLTDMTMPQMIVKPINQPDLEIIVDPDSLTGGIFVSSIIPGDPVQIIPVDPDWNEVKVEVTPNYGKEQNMGIIPLAKGTNHKVTIRMQNPQNDNISELFADNVTRNYIIEIENIGTTESIGASYEINFSNDDFEYVSGSRNGLLNTLAPGAKREINLALRSKPIKDANKLKEINVRTRHVDTGAGAIRIWDDTVSVNYYRVAIPFNFKSEYPVQGVIKTPRGETLYFKTARLGSTGDYTYSINVPWSNEDYIVAFLGATSQSGSESRYSLGINEIPSSDWNSLFGDALYRYHGICEREATAPEINMTDSKNFMYYLYSTAVQYFSLNLGEEPPAVINPPMPDGLVVTNPSDSAGSDLVPGTLRYAITNAPAGSVIRFYGALTIELTSSLTITKNITIEGSGSTLTRGSAWVSGTNSQLVRITGGTADFSRLHFKNGRATNNGAAIYVSGGTLNLESCILSGNQTSLSTALGGAVYLNGTALNIKGCTFYNNSTAYRGGAIYVAAGTLTLQGNLFYGNAAASSGGPVVYRAAGTVTSNGYNVSSAALGTGTTQSGWTPLSSDKTVSAVPFSINSFRLLQNSVPLGVITSLPANYPRYDFYGSPIGAGAAAGAVQGILSGNNIILSVNNDNYGTVSVSPIADEDGFYPNFVTVTAEPKAGCNLLNWLINGADAGSENPKTLTLNGSTTVRAVFARLPLLVTSSSDAAGSASVPGTLRYALTNAQDGDVIRLNEGLVIELTSALPQVTKSITIEGSGSALTRSSSYTAASSTSQLIYVNSTAAVVNIKRLHFKNGLATSAGAGVRLSSGAVLRLESCIFSGNRTTDAESLGGAIYNAGTMHIKACTFYGNHSSYYGGAIYNTGTLNLTGNLFYGNTAAVGAYIINNITAATVNSGGYNVSAAVSHLNAETDKVLTRNPISAETFKLLSNSEALGVITPIPGEYPLHDFYGSEIKDIAAAGAVQAIQPAVIRNVTNSSDAPGSEFAPGTLRYALTNAADGDIIQFNNELIIELARPLPWLNASVTIEGSGSVLTRNSAWSVIDNDSQLLNINTTADVVNISRLHFKNGRASDYGAAISNYSKSLTIESCIFSGNYTNLTEDQAWGGAIHNRGTMNVKGCTFYANSTTGIGGAVLISGGTLILQGNIFYGNTANLAGPVVYRYEGTVTSLGYNVVDAPLGTGDTQSGWAVAAGDKVVTERSFSIISFNPFSGGGADNVIPVRPLNYPAVDFYGNAINSGAAAGAVQPSGNLQNLGGVKLTITFNQIIDAAPNITGPTLYRVSNGGPTVAALTVANPEQYDTGSIKWQVDDTDVTGSGAVFELDAANIKYNQVGKHFVTVMVRINGVPYNKTVSFNVAY